MNEKFKIKQTAFEKDKRPMVNPENEGNAKFYASFLDNEVIKGWTGSKIIERAILNSKQGLDNPEEINTENIKSFLDGVAFKGGKERLHLLAKDLKNSSGFRRAAEDALSDEDKQRLVIVLDYIKNHYENKFLEQESPEIMEHIKTDFAYKEPKRINVVQKTRNPIVIQEENEKIMRLKNELGMDGTEAPKRINIKPR